MIFRAALLSLALVLPAQAQTPVEAATSAANGLRDAITALEAAQGAKDRVAALTQTITAYEQGLAVLRDGLRRAATREREIKADFEARRGQISQLLGVLTTMQQSPEPVLLFHPQGPLGTARSSMVLTALTPALQAQADKLRVELEEVALLRSVQQAAIDTLQGGMTTVQTARTALSQAVAERTDLPQRFLDDPQELKDLVASADTLDSFALGISEMEQDVYPPPTDFAGQKGALPLPVMGSVLRRFDEADAAGIRRPGLILATSPAALVTSPWAATIRYRGPLLDYGNVMILEPAEGYLLVLAGLGQVFGETGDVLAAGAPIGLMGGVEPQAYAEGFVAAAQDGSGADRPETLYMELREGNTPVDPADWFRATKG